MKHNTELRGEQMSATNEVSPAQSAALSDKLCVMFGTKWIVTREDNRGFYEVKTNVAVCASQEIALSFMRNQSDYGRYKIHYDCEEHENYE